MQLYCFSIPTTLLLENMGKIIIYQIFTRLFGNRNLTRKENGTITENGCGKMSFFEAKTLKRIRQLGVTHIWYTGIIRHATKTDYTSCGVPSQHPAVVKGNAGSPYAITDYYDVDPDLADNVDSRMKEFESLVERTHAAGLKVLIDFVPNHVARQYKSVAKPQGVADLGEEDDVNMGFSVRNNFYYCTGQPFNAAFDLYSGKDSPYEEFPAKATGNDCFCNHPDSNDWYETVKLNYGVDYCDAGGRSTHFSPVPDTWHKMLDILMFWASKRVDGFRCDMAEMVPHEFWTWAISRVKANYPRLLFVGEVYNPQLYRTYIASGFDYLYDKVGMYDCIKGVIRHERPASDITHQWQAVDDIHDHMLYFLENHDEQRIASDFFAGSGAKAVPALIANALMQTNPFMLYAGQEYGEHGMDKEGFSGHDGRTTIFDYWCVQSLYAGYVNRRKLTPGQKTLCETYAKVLNIAQKENAVNGGLFFDLMYANFDNPQFDTSRQYAFLRKNGSEMLLVVVNFCDEQVNCVVKIPAHAFEYLGLKPITVEATELVSGTKNMLSLAPDGLTAIKVGADSGCVYKLNVR